MSRALRLQSCCSSHHMSCALSEVQVAEPLQLALEKHGQHVNAEGVDGWELRGSWLGHVQLVSGFGAVHRSHVQYVVQGAESSAKAVSTFVHC